MKGNQPSARNRVPIQQRASTPPIPYPARMIDINRHLAFAEKAQSFRVRRRKFPSNGVPLAELLLKPSRPRTGHLIEVF
jgi:hypothetical protein